MISPRRTHSSSGTRFPTPGSCTPGLDELEPVIRWAANRDPARYRNAEPVDIHRIDGGHVAFHGIHFCLGAPLVRMEARIALSALTPRDAPRRRESMNIVDDVEHCLMADTSPHLVEQRTRSRDFLAGIVDDVLAGWFSAPADRMVVPPFGLGVLDLAVGKYVYDGVQRCGGLHVVPDFLHDLRRHG